MPDEATVATLVFATVGVFVAGCGAYVRVRRRADLLANYDGSADPEYAAVRAGNAVVAAGLVMVAYAAVDYYWRLPESAVLAPIVGVTALAFLAAARARGV